MGSRSQAYDEVAQALVAETLASGSGVRLRVRGSCMDPLLQDGDWVWVVPIGQMLPGSIVLAKSKNGHLVCHRLLQRVGADYLLAGDRSFALEKHPRKHVLGQVQHAEQGGLRLLMERPGWLGRFLAGWHLMAYGSVGGIFGRLVEAVRQRFVALVHRISWRWGGRAIHTE